MPVNHDVLRGPGILERGVFEIEDLMIRQSVYENRGKTRAPAVLSVRAIASQMIVSLRHYLYKIKLAVHPSRVWKPNPLECTPKSSEQTKRVT